MDGTTSSAHHDDEQDRFVGDGSDGGEVIAEWLNHDDRDFVPYPEWMEQDPTTGELP